MRSDDTPSQAQTFQYMNAVVLRPRVLPLTLAMGLTSLALIPGALAQTSAESDTVEMQPMVVTGTALKVEAPLAETPRPASVVQREELEERNVQSLDETFRYRAGVLSGHYGADNNTDWFKVRGFDQSTYQDGLRIYREGYYQWLPEPFGLEQVELLKGPASILYGEAPPGALSMPSANALPVKPKAVSRSRPVTVNTASWGSTPPARLPLMVMYATAWSGFIKNVTACWTIPRTSATTLRPAWRWT